MWATPPASQLTTAHVHVICPRIRVRANTTNDSLPPAQKSKDFHAYSAWADRPHLITASQDPASNRHRQYQPTKTRTVQTRIATEQCRLQGAYLGGPSAAHGNRSTRATTSVAQQIRTILLATHCRTYRSTHTCLPPGPGLDRAHRPTTKHPIATGSTNDRATTPHCPHRSQNCHPVHIQSILRRTCCTLAFFVLH